MTTKHSPWKDLKASPKRINCMKETMNFLKAREESKNSFIRNQAYEVVREYVENRKNNLHSKNKAQDPSEQMRSLLNSSFIHPKGKPLVYLEGISNGRKVINRAGKEHQSNTLKLVLNTAKEVVNKRKKADKMIVDDYLENNLDFEPYFQGLKDLEKIHSSTNGSANNDSNDVTVKRRVGRPRKDSVVLKETGKKIDLKPLGKRVKKVKAVKKITKKKSIGRPRKYA